MVFQNPETQFVGATVLDDLAFGMENFEYTTEEMKKRTKEILERFGMWEQRFLSPKELSGGQKQKVAVMGALLLEPDVLVLDEATSMLDPSGKEMLMQMFRETQNGGDRKSVV